MWWCGSVFAICRHLVPAVGRFLFLPHQVYLQDEERMERRERKQLADQGGCHSRGGERSKAAALGPCDDNTAEREAAAKVGCACRGSSTVQHEPLSTVIFPAFFEFSCWCPRLFCVPGLCNTPLGVNVWCWWRSALAPTYIVRGFALFCPPLTLQWFRIMSRLEER